MADSISSVASVATQMMLQKSNQQVQLTVLNKVKQIQEQQGKAVLQLLESASPVKQGIDVRV